MGRTPNERPRSREAHRPARPHPDAAAVPAWLRKTAGEPRLPVLAAVVAAIVLQALLPTRLTIRPSWLMPGLEGFLLLGLMVANPLRLTRENRLLRGGSLALTAVISGANAVSAGLLIHDLLRGSHQTEQASTLLSNGAAVYLTNIIAFGLWYWEFDRGGPFDRAAARRQHPDFLFPQMVNPGVTHSDWEPMFVDYLYVSFTNAVAFSPTDTMPLSRWAKMLMLAQSAVALATSALVIARVVNILK